MERADTTEMASFQVPAHEAEQLSSYSLPKDSGAPVRPWLSELSDNVRWFCGLRWIVASILLGFGVLSFIPAATDALLLELEPAWLLTVGGVVVVGNFFFLYSAHKSRHRKSVRAVRMNLWAQIVFDLIMLTAVVHFVGSLNTFGPSGYLFHTVLACIFFSPIESFLVTSLAVFMFVTVVGLESLGVLAERSAFAEVIMSRGDPGFIGTVWHITLTASILFIVWFLVAKLSGMVRRRQAEIIDTNRMLVEANAERVRHMLHTAHELKAPFAAIYANIQLLERGSLGEIPDKAKEVLGRMRARCKGLSQEIKEMLQLANLESRVQDIPPLNDLNLEEVILSCLERIKPMMDVRNISVEHELEPATVMAFSDHMVMLFENLLANAVAYSHDGGTVQVECKADPIKDAVVIIRDNGIGIEEKKLEKIFDAYYRTEVAVQHNQASTGLGLTIVRHVAQVNGIGLQVESAPGKGTKFTVKVPHFPGENGTYS
ncbi:MAG: sensor histidine kinase [Planctomycetota bacterium]|jgi:signal transduction histidine kinase